MRRRATVSTRSSNWPSPISIWPGAFRSPLSARPAGVFPLGSLRWLLGRLVAELNRRTRSERWQRFRLLAIDHTTLTLPETRPLWRRFRAHRGEQGLGPIAVEFACLFHLVSRAPFRFTLARSATSDHRLIQKLIPALKKGDLLLIDSGFYFLTTFLRIRQRGAHFLIPAKTSHRPRVIRKLTSGDYLCRLIRGDQSLVVRVCYVERPGFRPRRRLVTSLLDAERFPASQLAVLYHWRWGVETFYRDFKHTLRATHWHCRTPTTFKQELILHLITVCLIRLAMLEAARRGKVTVAQLSFSRSLTQIRVFFRRLCRLPLPHWEHLYADLINACAAFLVRIKPGRSFSRDRQQYRRKARGLEPTRPGRKPVTTPVPSRPKPEVRYDHCLLP